MERRLENIRRRMQEHLIPIGVKMLFSCIVFSPMLIEHLVNNVDGIWNGVIYTGGDWEMALGRWLIRYVDMLRLGMNIEPLNMLTALLLFVLGTEVFSDCFGLARRSFADYAAAFLFLGTLSVCVHLSYAYSAIVYGLAFLSSMLCVRCIILASQENVRTWREAALPIAGGAFWLAVMMGLYQAFLGCTLLAALGALILLVADNAQWKRIWNFVLRGLAVGALGFALYELLLNVEIARYGHSINSYQGGDSITLRHVLGQAIPRTKLAYQTFADFFIGEGFNNSIFQGLPLCALMLGLLIVPGAIVLVRLMKQSKAKAAIFAALWLLVPLACNFTMILAPDSYFLAQQTSPLCLVASVLVAVLFQAAELKPGKQLAVRLAASAVSFVLIFGNVMQVQIDQEAMREGTAGVKTIVASAAQRIIEQGLLQDGRMVMFAGDLNGNPLFYNSEVYGRANNYAHMGAFASPVGTAPQQNNAWIGVQHSMLGICLPECSNEQFAKLVSCEAVRNMPIYPAEGSIQVIDDVIVVHISN